MDPLNFLFILNLIDKIPVEARPFVAAILVFLVFAACMAFIRGCFNMKTKFRLSHIIALLIYGAYFVWGLINVFT